VKSACAGTCPASPSAIIASVRVITIDPEIMSGTPVFCGTRVPIAYLFEYLGENRLPDFLLDYPGVSREQVDELIRQVPLIIERLPQAQSVAS